MAADLALVAVGLVLLSKAADHFVMGAARIAIAVRLSAVVVGAVIIGFGTSAPEMLVSAIAASGGESDLGLGNIIGSNVANLTLVLGVAALVTPIVVGSSVIRREAPLSLGGVLLFAGAVQGGISTAEAAVLLVALVGALGWMITSSRGAPDSLLAAEVDEFVDVEEPHSVGRESLRTLLGLVGTLVGAQMLVEGATGAAEAWGLSGGFVGLTLVAIGTSLPELVTSVAAARQDETDLIVGNLLGSNLFNSLAVGGIVGIFGDGTVGDPTLTGLATWLMIGVAVLAVVFMARGRVVARGEAAVLLVVYVASVPFLA